MSMLFMMCLALLLWPYIGFPLALMAIAHAVPKPKGYLTCNQASISVVIAAHNEAENLSAKLDSIYSQSVLSQCVQIIVLSDGSTDNTTQVLAPYLDKGLIYKDLPRQGKANVLNHIRSELTGDIVVFSDADTRWQPNTLEALIAPFSDESVGGTGGLIHVDNRDKHIGFGDYVYRQYETVIRQSENRLGVVVGFDGGLFAIRRLCWDAPVPTDVTDDFYLSTCPVVKGFRLVFVSNAIALDTNLESSKAAL